MPLIRVDGGDVGGLGNTYSFDILIVNEPPRKIGGGTAVQYSKIKLPRIIMRIAIYKCSILHCILHIM